MREYQEQMIMARATRWEQEYRSRMGLDRPSIAEMAEMVKMPTARRDLCAVCGVETISLNDGVSWNHVDTLSPACKPPRFEFKAF